MVCVCGSGAGRHFLELAVIACIEGLDLGGLRLAVNFVPPIIKMNVVYNLRCRPLFYQPLAQQDFMVINPSYQAIRFSPTLTSPIDTHIS
jgi:hypothetical protein